MRSEKSLSSVALLCGLALAGCAHTMPDGADREGSRAESNREVEALVARETPSNLAAAAVLATAAVVAGNPSARQPLELIERAEALASHHPELAWLHLRICNLLECEAKARIEARVQAVDPDNGFVWMSDLEKAQSSGSDAAVTAAIARIGAAPKMAFYWNQLEVMTVDALAVANPSRDLATRGIRAIGLLGVEAIPPLQPLAKPCRFEQLELPGRRAACELMVANMERSDTVLAHSLALGLQERWWPTGSPQREVVSAKRRRLDYVMTTAGRIRGRRLNRDMAARIDAARRTDREEDVDLAILEASGLSAEPPANWKDTLHPS